MGKNACKEEGESSSRREQEQDLVILIDHLKRRIPYYASKLEDAEKRLNDSQTKLASLRAKQNAAASSSRSSTNYHTLTVKFECSNPINQPRSEQELVILPEDPKTSSSSRSKTNFGMRTVKSDTNPIHQPPSERDLIILCKDPKTSPTIRSPINYGMRPVKASPNPIDRPPSKQELIILPETPKTSVGALVSTPSTGDKRQYSEPKEIQSRVTKRKLDQKEHKELIPLIRGSSSRFPIHCYSSNVISSKHKRKLRSLALCPVDDDLFVTSALDGLVNTWKIQSKWSTPTATILGSTDCLSPKTRRWPDDIAWHPQGHSIFSVYTADGDDSQISVLDLSREQGRSPVTFLEDRPHLKGNVNNIEFMPWEETCFATGGSDHAVVLWTEDDNSWKPKALHKNLHSSAVMGVAGLHHKQLILSVGADKRIISYDIQGGRQNYKHQLENKCMNILTNPCDFNLLMVHTGTYEKQLR